MVDKRKDDPSFDELFWKPIPTNSKPKRPAWKSVLIGIAYAVLVLLFAVGIRMLLAWITGNQYPWWLF